MYLNGYRYILFYILYLYISITISMSLALSTCALFISLMQSVTGGQFLNIICLPLFPPPSANAATAIVPFTNTFASLNLLS